MKKLIIILALATAVAGCGPSSEDVEFVRNSVSLCQECNTPYMRQYIDNVLDHGSANEYKRAVRLINGHKRDVKRYQELFGSTLNIIDKQSDEENCKDRSIQQKFENQHAEMETIRNRIEDRFKIPAQQTSK